MSRFGVEKLRVSRIKGSMGKGFLLQLLITQLQVYVKLIFIKVKCVTAGYPCGCWVFDTELVEGYL